MCFVNSWVLYTNRVLLCWLDLCIAQLSQCSSYKSKKHRSLYLRCNHWRRKSVKTDWHLISEKINFWLGISFLLYALSKSLKYYRYHKCVWYRSSVLHIFLFLIKVGIMCIIILILHMKIIRFQEINLCKIVELCLQHGWEIALKFFPSSLKISTTLSSRLSSSLCPQYL